MRVHGIARRTLFDPEHDEQPFCQDLTERRRTTVRFLGQQSDVTIDDTWPQAGEMRSLWKGTTEFRTNDKPQDDTWKPNRHHSNILPLCRTVAMFPLPPNPVASTEHGAEIPTCPLCHTPRMPRIKGDAWFWWSELSNVYSSHHDDPPVPQHLKTLLLKQQTQAVNDRIPAKGWSSPEQMAREREIRVSCAELSSTTRARSLESGSRSRGNAHGTGEQRRDQAVSSRALAARAVSVQVF